MSSLSNSYIDCEEDGETAEQDCGAGDGEGEEETAGVVHEGADDGPDGEAEVEGGVTPGLQQELSVSRNIKCQI